MTSANGLPTIQTSTGKCINYMVPDHRQICIEDIAQGLSNICRFTGQCREFYSVAQHSAQVEFWLATWPEIKGLPASRRLNMRRVALLHDATEAYMGDMVRPLKRLCPEYAFIEDKLFGKILKAFGLKRPEPWLMDLLKKADSQVLDVEGFLLMPPCWNDGREPIQALKTMMHGMVPLPPKAAKGLFKLRFEELFG